MAGRIVSSLYRNGLEVYPNQPVEYCQIVLYRIVPLLLDIRVVFIWKINDGYLPCASFQGGDYF